MGQIIGGAAKPKRCNINQLSQLGTPAAGEHILVSSDNSMNAVGQGNFDCYIIGDGQTAATALELKPILKNGDYIIANKEQIETLVGNIVINAGSITGNYTPISGLIVGKKYVLKLTLNANATVTVATATDGSLSYRVSPYIYTSKYLAAGSHIIEFTYNGGSYLALHDSGLGYSVFSSFVIYKSLMNEINEINGNIVQTIGADSNERQYPSAICLRNQFEVVPQTRNLLDPNALTSGYISNSNGTISSHNSFFVTDFIDVTGIESLYFYVGTTMTTTPLFFILAYDANKQPISASYTQQASSPYSIPNGSTYIRFSFNPANITNPFLSSQSEIAFIPFVGNRIVKGDSTYLRIKEVDDYLQDNVKEYLPNTVVSFEQISGKLINSRGVIVDFQNTNNCISEEITVVEGISYSITANANFGNMLYAFYNSNDTMISYEQSGSGSSITSITSKVVVCPAGATKLRIACILPNKSSLFTNRVTSKAELYFPFKDKKWVCIGDSLTEYNQRTSIHYFDYVSKATGINIVNLGISGTGYAKGGSTNNFLTRVPSIPLDADVITIFGSFNDLSAGKQIGNIDDDDDSTLCGCINLVLDAIQDRLPLVPLGIVSPTPWKNAMPNVSVDSAADNYVSALKRICDYRSIPFVDLYHSSNLHPNSPAFRVLCYSKDGTYANSTESTPEAIEVTSDNIDTINSFLADGSTAVVVGDWVLPDLLGCHPNEEGHKLIAGRFDALLKSIL